MLQNFITITVRNFLRQKLYSVINVLGLSTGLLCVLLIYLWVSDEIKKNKFHRNGEKIYRIVSNLTVGDGSLVTWEVAPGLLAEDIAANVPEVEMSVRTSGTEKLIGHEQSRFMESGLFADPGFFELFSFDILHGKPSLDSNDVSSISISARLAEKLFTSAATAIGKTVVVSNKETYTVTSVFRDPGSPSTLQFSFVLPYEIYRKNRGEQFTWGNFDHPTYVKLEPSAVAVATQKINTRAEARADGEGGETSFYLQPFEDAYLHSHFEGGQPVGGRIEYVKIFSVVGVFMLIIACINFTNMATARAAFRAKEVGIRKVVGAQRKSIISQFIMESIAISLVSMLLALAVGYLVLPGFNLLVKKSITIDISDPTLLAAICLVVVITGILAGSYPALFLSSFQPAKVLKGTMSGQFSGSGLRRLLVVFQFTLTVVLIASSIVIYSQINFIRNKNIGYDREHVMTFPALGSVKPKFDAVRNEILALPGIVNAGLGNESLVLVNNQNSSVTWPGKDDNFNPFFRTVVTDFGFMQTMGLRLVEGRFFSREQNDTSKFVLTQKAVEVMGLTNPIGTTISQWGVSGEVIGVVENFHSRSLHEAMDPIVFMCNPEWTWKVFVRFESGQIENTLPLVQGIFNKYSDGYPFQYSFLDEDFEKLYESETVTGTLALGFTFMAIVISALGLVGLASYTAERRRKEISIRKTFGATVTSIVTMVSTDFIRLSLIAAVIGCPLAYFLMDSFLSGYAFRTALDWKIFGITAVAMMLICMVTVIFQVVRAAMANPVNALRNE
jgi:putative ABC transport system permease protein